MKDQTDRLEPRPLDGRHLAHLDGAAPGQKFPGGSDRGNGDENEQRQFGDECPIVKIVVGPFLKMEHAAKTHQEYDASGDAEDHVRHKNLACTPERQLVLEEHEFDHQGGNQCECRKVMQESKKRCHSGALHSATM